MNGSTYSRDRDYPFTNVGTIFQDSSGLRMRATGVNRYDQSYSYFTQSSTSYSDGGHGHLQPKAPTQTYISPMTSWPAVAPVTYGPRPFLKNPNVFNGIVRPTYPPDYSSTRWRQSQQSYSEPKASASSSQQPFEQHRDQRYVSGPRGRSLLAIPEQATVTSQSKPAPVQNLEETGVRNNQPPWTVTAQSPACQNLMTPSFPVWPPPSRRESNYETVAPSPLIIRTLTRTPRPVGQASLPVDTDVKPSTLKNTKTPTENGAPSVRGAAPRKTRRVTRRKVKEINVPEKSGGSCELLKRLISSPPCTQSQLSVKIASMIAHQIEKVPHELDNTKRNGVSPNVFESMKLPVKLPVGNNNNSICAFSYQNPREKDRVQLSSSMETDIAQLSSSKVMDGAQLSSSMETDRAQLYSSVETDRAQLYSSMEMDSGQLSSSKVMDGAQLSSSNAMDRAQLSSSNVMDRAQLSSPNVTDRAQLSPSKETGRAKLSSSNVMDRAQLSSSKETRGAQLLKPMLIARANVLAAVVSLKHQVSFSNETARSQVLSSNETARVQVLPSNETDRAQVLLSNETDRAQVLLSNETDRAQVLSSNETDRAQVLSSSETDRAQLLLSKEIDTAIVSSKQNDSSKEVSSRETDKVQVFLTETDSSQVLSSKETDSAQLLSPKETVLAEVLPLKEITKSNVLSSNNSIESHKPQVLPPTEILSSKALLTFDEAKPISFMTFFLDSVSPKLETVKVESESQCVAETVKVESESQCVAETNALFCHLQDANSRVCNNYFNSESIHTPESMSFEDSNAASLQGLEDCETLDALEPGHNADGEDLPPNFLIENPRGVKPNSDHKEEFVTGHQFYTCTACGYSFGKEFLLWVHLVTRHSADEFLACPYCNLSVMKGMYIAHMKIAHFNTASHLFGCGGLLNAWQCTYLSETIPELTGHMDLNHSKEIEFRCVNCNYFSASIRSYIVHATTCKPLGDATVKSRSESLTTINSSWHTMSQLSELVDALHQSSTCTNYQNKDESTPQKHSTVEFSSPPTPPKSPCTPSVPSKRERTVRIRMVPMDAQEVEVIKMLKTDYVGTIDNSVGGSKATCPAVAKGKDSRDSLQGNVRKFDTKCDGIKTLNAAKSKTVTQVKDKKEGKPFHCVFCGKGELCVDDVVRHQKRRHWKNKMAWELSDVRLTFARDGTLLDGDFKQLKKSRYLCSMCSFRSDRRSSVTKHMISEHSQRLFTGHVIKLRKSAKTRLPDARISRSEVKCYACNQCSYKTTTIFHFRLHMANHDANQDRLVPVVCEKVAFRCGTCGYFAVDSADFRAHEEIHLHQQRFLCGYCSHDDDTEEKVGTHIRSSHGSLPLLMYDRQILYNEMAKEPQKMILIFPKVVLSTLDENKYMKWK
ncbi:unnamed protein product [Lymnaea stagnalis]|uniref:C2H2-type domain-containing protein n=1 Tax=Lymnaea stagnalis TaxID=6523 RepID=A0AAV2I6M5_LYMST